MAGLFHVDQQGKLTALTQANYPTEDRLQSLLSDYPELLGGDQMSSGEPRRWLLVAREAPVPDSEGGAGRWSLDHLFLDQDAVPTFVEVKRASDSRIRREVVGQMLDYAANGLRYWPVETIQGFLAQDGESADARLSEAFGQGVDPVDYWQRLKDNLTEGKIRLLFVADRIPNELLAIIEFLNAHMDHTDVLAVEIPQYLGEGGLCTLAPRVLGQTQAAIAKRQGSRTTRTWDEQSYFETIDRELPPSDAAAVRRYYDWVREQVWPIAFGRGAIYGSFAGKIRVAGKDCVYPVICYTSGLLEFGFAWLSAPFDDDVTLREFIRRMNAIPGADFSEDASTPGNKYPKRSVSILASEEGFAAFTDALLWYKAEVEKAASAAE
jgi:hypothetical protein